MKEYIFEPLNMKRSTFSRDELEKYGKRLETMQENAIKAGFSIDDVNNAFKKLSGQTPSEFRKSNGID